MLNKDLRGFMENCKTNKNALCPNGKDGECPPGNSCFSGIIC